jgi:hypothetical protein
VTKKDPLVRFVYESRRKVIKTVSVEVVFIGPIVNVGHYLDYVLRQPPLEVLEVKDLEEFLKSLRFLRDLGGLDFLADCDNFARVKRFQKFREVFDEYLIRLDWVSCHRSRLTQPSCRK